MPTTETAGTPRRESHVSGLDQIRHGARPVTDASLVTVGCQNCEQRVQEENNVRQSCRQPREKRSRRQYAEGEQE